MHELTTRDFTRRILLKSTAALSAAATLSPLVAARTAAQDNQITVWGVVSFTEDGDALLAEHRLLEIARGHDADLHDVARARHLGGRCRRAHTVPRRRLDLLRHHVVTGHSIAAGAEPPREGVPHQAEADEAERRPPLLLGLRFRHRSALPLRRP